MNLLSVVNQLLSRDSESPETPYLLGLPSELVGVDLAELEDDLKAHREEMEKTLGHPVHEATVLLDYLDRKKPGSKIEDFCVLKKSAMEDLVQAAIYDGLTGLHSRNIMDTRLHEEFRRAKRYELPLSILFVDIDDFKNINDNFGHAEGDRTLTFFGRFVLDRLREVDIPVRYGGEEFVIILPHTDGETALDLARQLHEGVGKAQDDAGLQQQLTISIGVGTLTTEMSSESDLLDAADRAVYLAKQEKNQVWPGINGHKEESSASTD